jgi:hypothetical protein
MPGEAAVIGKPEENHRELLIQDYPVRRLKVKHFRDNSIAKSSDFIGDSGFARSASAPQQPPQSFHKAQGLPATAAVQLHPPARQDTA